MKILSPLLSISRVHKIELQHSHQMPIPCIWIPLEQHGSKHISKYSKGLTYQRAIKVYFHLVKRVNNDNTIKNLLELCFHLLSSFLVLLSGDFVELWALRIKIDSRVFSIQEDKMCARSMISKKYIKSCVGHSSSRRKISCMVAWILTKIHVKLPI